ncbi:fructokinase [Streptococcus pseudoporcinus]|uniref:Fructokinase n=1 Tax=Streptococcus pseudoporcinus TaxID=361101 RepID=A0A4U9XNV0_9STRE|nr:fructokinase ScrK [Streptococcus pseudoporcinus]VTS14582.1 fructokinase [Streptococcus pseudoporcinus]
MAGLYGSIEAGGTKFVCAVGDDQFKIIKHLQFPTTSVEETIANCITFFEPFRDQLLGIGIGSFGPIDSDQDSPTYGYITNTPKEGWANVDFLSEFTKALSVPVFFTTDVNSSAYGELLARPRVNSLVYYTVGTGIGAGAIQGGQLIGGLGHTEAGHTYVRPHSSDLKNGFTGICPFHQGCLEGMASGPSLEARTGVKGELLPIDSPVWDIQAFYIAQAALQASMLYRPELIVFGGGVMAQNHMLERVRHHFEVLLNGYLPVTNLKKYIVTPAVINNGSATLGNFDLAKKVSKKSEAL